MPLTSAQEPEGRRAARLSGPLILVLLLVGVIAATFYMLSGRRSREREVAVPHDLDAAESELRAHYDAALEYLILLQEDLSAKRLDMQTFYLRADAYLRDHPELTLMAWADEQFHYAWVAPEDPRTRPIIGVPVTIQQEEDAARAARATRRPALSQPYVSIQGTRGFTLYVPVFVGEHFLGTFSGFFSFDALLAHAVPSWVRARYQVGILGAGGVAMARGGAGGKLDEALSSTRRIALAGTSQELSLRLVPVSEGPDWELLLLGMLAVGLSLGVSLGILELMRDNRRKRLAAEEMQRSRDLAESANRSKTEFLATVSHEIRTPIGAIIGYAETLSMQAGRGAAAAPEIVAAIRRNGENLLHLINDLLDLTKVEAGLLEIEMAPTDVGVVVSEALLAIRPLAEAKDLALEVACGGAVPARLTTDPARLRQALVNVLSNAVKFTSQGQVTLTLRLERGGDAPLLAMVVADTGIGIGAEAQQRLFRSFGQADGSIARRFGGTGLGLALSRKLARLLGGDLALTRTEVGRGSVFTLTVATGPLAGVPLVTTLPFLPTSKTAPAREPYAAAGSGRLRGRRFLIVEDTFDNQVIFREFLESEGAQVEVAGGGVAALRRARGEPQLDLILMDIQMPGMNGYEATRELRAAGFAGPIVALTAHAMKGERERCLAAGCSDFVTKPIDREALVARVADVCGGPAAAPAARGDGAAGWAPAGASAPGDRGAAPAARGEADAPTGSGLDAAAPGAARDRGPAAAATAPGGDGAPLLSAFRSDERVRRVLAGFVGRLPDRVADLGQAVSTGDYQRLARLAHALVGAAGSYGYPDISGAAGEVEMLARAHAETRQITRLVAALDSLQRRARAGIQDLEKATSSQGGA